MPHCVRSQGQGEGKVTLVTLAETHQATRAKAPGKGVLLFISGSLMPGTQWVLGRCLRNPRMEVGREETGCSLGVGGFEVTKLEGWREEGCTAVICLSELSPAWLSVQSTQVHITWGLAAISSAVPPPPGFLTLVPPTSALAPGGGSRNKWMPSPPTNLLFFFLLQKLMYCIFI